MKFFERLSGKEPRVFPQSYIESISLDRLESSFVQFTICLKNNKAQWMSNVVNSERRQQLSDSQKCSITSCAVLGQYSIQVQGDSLNSVVDVLYKIDFINEETANKLKAFEESAEDKSTAESPGSPSVSC